RTLTRPAPAHCPAAATRAGAPARPAGRGCPARAGPAAAPALAGGPASGGRWSWSFLWRTGWGRQGDKEKKAVATPVGRGNALLVSLPPCLLVSPSLLVCIKAVAATGSVPAPPRQTTRRTPRPRTTRSLRNTGGSGRSRSARARRGLARR